jgi:thiamine biosynthesis lipoprotein
MDQPVTLEFEAIGTQWSIEFSATAEQAQKLARQIADRISQFDKDYSRFRSDSWVSRAGSHPGAHKAPADFEPMFRLYQKMYEITDGLVTPLIGDALERAGYDAKYSLQPKRLKAIPQLADVLEFTNNTLHVKHTCVLDFGAAGKGYLIDLLGKLLEQQGAAEYVINAGGDILVHSPSPTKTTPVGLEDPDDPSKVLSVVELSNQSICASSGNRRNWGPYHHIINPKTLHSVNDIKAVWVVAKTALLADGLATCLFFIPPEKLSTTSEFEYLVLTADGQARRSLGFPVHNS